LGTERNYLVIPDLGNYSFRVGLELISQELRIGFVFLAFFALVVFVLRVDEVMDCLRDANLQLAGPKLCLAVIVYVWLFLHVAVIPVSERGSLLACRFLTETEFTELVSTTDAAKLVKLVKIVWNRLQN
jgi:hypothetical protein